MSSRSWARLASIVAVSAAAGWVVHGRPLTPFDASLPIVAAALAIVAWVAREPTLELAPVVLIAVAAAVPDDRLRLLAYGVVVAAAFAGSVLAASSGAILDRGDAIALAVAFAAIFRLVPIEGRDLAAELLVFGGLAALVAVASAEGRVPLGAFAIALVAAILTPADPTRAALAPLVLAACCWHLRGSRWLAPLAAIPIALAAGRWALPIVAVAVALRWIEDRGWPLAVRWGIAGGFAALGFAIRPALGVLYLVTGLLFSLSGRDSEEGVSIALVAYLSVAAVIVAWSGAIAPAFPLPLSLPALLAVAALVFVAALRDWRWIAVPAAALFAFAIVSFEPRIPRRHEVGVALAPGEPLDIPSPPARSIDLVLSGANVAHLERGTLVATIEVLAEKGAGYRRMVRIGEIADWGAFREGFRFRSENSPPRRLVAIHGLGPAAYPAGAGVIALAAPEPIASIRVTAAPSLPPDARLQVESFEVR